MDIRKHFKQSVKKWVAKNYGENEASNPSWDIDSLAEMLADEFFVVKQGYEMDNLIDDVKMVAKEHNIDISEGLAETVADDYYYSDAYGSVDRDYILDEIAYRKGEQ